jgi:D-alanine-D-alanine ligase
MRRYQYHVALIYNSYASAVPEAPEDRGGTADLRMFIRRMARVLRKIGYRVTIVSLANDLLAFQRRLSRLRPDVVFNQYDDVVHGAFYEMRVAALIQMMGFPMTGSPALALGLGRYKYMCSSLLHGAGIPIPPNTQLLERIGDVDQRTWEFPLIVQPSHEHAGVGLDRNSVVHTKAALRDRVREILQTYAQPALAQRFLPGREFNVALLGGRKLSVLPLAEVDYSELPSDIPPIMSYAAKWMENTVEYKKTRVICPAQVEPELARDISSIALRAFRALGGWGYGRVDIRLDENQRPHVLDVNCNASLEEGVALARSAEKAGLDYPHLLQQVVRIAMEGPSFDVGVPMLGREPAAKP